MKWNTNIRTYFLLILAMFFWSFSYIWLKETYSYISPLAVLLLRMFVAVIFLIILTSFLGKLQKVKKKDWKYLMLMAFFEPFLYYIGESYGVKFTSPTTTAVMIATIPLFMPIVGFFFIKEKFRIENFFGILISFFGILLIIFNKNIEIQASAIGLAFLAGAVISALIYSVLLKKLADKYNSYTIVLWQSVFGLLFFIPLYFSMKPDDLAHINIDYKLILYICGLAIFSTSLAYIFFATGVRKLGVTKATVFANLIPLFTAFFAFLLGAEIFSTRKIIGIVVVVVGVLISQYNRKLKIRRKP
jgi:drug/metabolite transporter (DMT)-like permease